MGRSLAEPASSTIPIKTGPDFGGQATSGLHLGIVIGSPPALVTKAFKAESFIVPDISFMEPSANAAWYPPMRAHVSKYPPVFEKGSFVLKGMSSGFVQGTDLFHSTNRIVVERP